MKKGKFIVFEGIDGSGKSTHARLLKDNLNARGIEVYSTFEPTDYETGKLLRRFLSGEVKADERTVAALFMADRMEHLLNADNGILQKIHSGITVICDRYFLSSVAYNCHDEGIEWIFSINQRVREILSADITIFLDAPIEHTGKRTARRGSLEVYEKGEIQAKVRERYLNAISCHMADAKVAIIDTNRDKLSVSKDIWAKVEPLFEEKTE